MDDVLTDIPPPSRFFSEDLNNFTPPSSPLPRPSLLFTKPDCTLRPSLLIIAISSPSLQIVHRLSSKTHVGTLVLPETLLTGNPVEPSLRDKSCNIYALTDAKKSTLIASFQYSIPVERSHAVAKLLIGEHIIPERVLILDSVQSRNFRGRLSPDDTFGFKLETSSERRGTNDGIGNSPLIKVLDYFPSGSVVDGLAAALLSRCQLKRIKGTLCVTWPEFGVSVTSLVKSLLLKVSPELDHMSIDNMDNDRSSFACSKDSLRYSGLYT